jgi:hypothetical protein
MFWTERNRKTFDSKIKTVYELLACLEEEVVTWLLARFKEMSAFVAACDRVACRHLLIM